MVMLNKVLLLFLSFLFTESLWGEGFHLFVKVMISDGLIRIKDVKPGHKVFAFGGSSGVVKTEVTDVEWLKIYEYYIIQSLRQQMK